MEEKRKLQVRCPDCKTLNLLVKADFAGRALITFLCANCKRRITLENPDVESTFPVSSQRFDSALEGAQALFAYADDMGMIKRSRKNETANQVAGMVEQASREAGIEEDSEEFKLVMQEMMRLTGCQA